MSRVFGPRVLAVLLLLLLVSAVYWPGLSGGFLFDDFPNIVTNPLVHAETLDAESLSRAARAYQPGYYGRPLATLGFALDYSLTGKNAFAFKVHSLLVHLLNALLVFVLLRRLLALPRAQVGAGWGVGAAFTIALLWAVHPLQVSSVLYIVQRMETLATTFVLLALLAYLRGRAAQIAGRGGWSWLAGSVLLAGIGMLSKETAILFPLFALALELTVLRFEATSPATARAIRWIYMAVVAGALLVFVAYVVPKYWASDAYYGRDFSSAERLLTQARVLMLYLGQIALPLPSSMTFFYDDYAKSSGLLSPPSTLLSLIAILGLLGLAWRVRSTRPLVSLGILWFFAAHALTSGIFALELVFEHRNYFALLGVLLVLADVVARLQPRDGPAIVRAGVAALVLGFGVLGLIRSAMWGEPLMLAADLAAKNPHSARAASDLATLYVSMADGYPNSPFYAMGMREFERASGLPSASAIPEQGLILSAAVHYQPVEDRWWDSLIHKVRTQHASPQLLMSVEGLMTQRYKGIELDDQRLSEAYAAMLQRRPQAHLFAQYGDFALTYLHDRELARQSFVRAAELSRNNPAWVLRMVETLTAEGHADIAKAVLERADALGIEVVPAHPGAR